MYEQQAEREMREADPEVFKNSIYNPVRYKVDGPNYDGLELKRTYSIITVVVIMLIGVVSISIHYSQQTSPKKQWLYDGNGPQLMWNATEHAFDSSRQTGQS
jgi:hypothetical protein